MTTCRPRRRALRVCLATFAPGHGGLQTVTANLCRYLTGRGYEVTPLYLGPPVPTRRIARYLLFGSPRWEEAWGRPALAVDHLAHLELLRYLIPALKVRGSLRGFDVYHVIRGANLAEALFAVNGHRFVDWVATTVADERRSQSGATSPGSAGRRMLASVNGCLEPLLQRQERWVLRRAAIVDGISGYVRRQLVEVTGLPPLRVGVLHLPVDTRVFAPGNRDGRQQTRYVLAVGRLDDPRKNLPLLIEAFARISPRNPEVELRLVGPLEDRTWLDARDRTLGIAHQVRYLGELSLPELVRQYQDAEAVVLSSRQEGFGMALVEAMACGTPVVSTRCGGPEEIVRDGITGFLTPVGDAGALAEAAERILSDRALRASMGRAAREDVCHRFAMEVIGAQVLRRYHEAYPELPE